MFSGNGVADYVLKTAKTKTPFMTSENYRRLPEDSLFGGILRELGNMSMHHLDGIIDDSNVSIFNSNFFQKYSF